MIPEPKAAAHACTVERAAPSEGAQELERVLAELQAEMKTMQKDHAELLGVLSHDLRSPLSGIREIAHLMAREACTMPPEQIREFCMLVAQQSDRLLHLTRDILELSAHGCGRVTLNLAPCDPRFLFRSACRLYEELARRKQIQFEISIGQNAIHSVWVDADRIQTVLTNLLDNAVKYCDKGNTIRVSLDGSERWVAFTVSDNGQGIPKSELSRLFVRFGRGSSKPTGGEPSTGLGLALAREIVLAHGGQISVDGDRGVGLTFHVLLPVHKALLGAWTEKVKERHALSAH